jgi:EAL domain-containing protein (putative c-di-GMP-specific phosphodiesterase class I)
MDSSTQIVKAIENLRELGVRLSIDDFGTGFCSLAYVKRLPVSTVKIDQSFIRNIDTDPRNASVARAIISLGHGLGMEVVAEGVESKDELSLLSRERCDGVQGYLFSHPLSSVEFDAFATAEVRGRAARAAARLARGPSGERPGREVTAFPALR